MSKTIICKDVKGQKHSIPEHEMKFRPSAYGLIIQENTILMVPQHQEHFHGFDLPGGGVEIYETLEQAVTREVKEETGFEVAVGELVWATTSFFVPAFDRGGWNAIALYYLAKRVKSKLVCSSEQATIKYPVVLPRWWECFLCSHYLIPCALGAGRGLFVRYYWW